MCGASAYSTRNYICFIWIASLFRFIQPLIIVLISLIVIVIDSNLISYVRLNAIEPTVIGYWQFYSIVEPQYRRQNLISICTFTWAHKALCMILPCIFHQKIHRFYYLCRIIFHNFWKFNLYGRIFEKCREIRVVFGHLRITMNKNTTETIKKRKLCSFCLFTWIFAREEYFFVVSRRRFWFHIAAIAVKFLYQTANIHFWIVPAFGGLLQITSYVIYTQTHFFLRSTKWFGKTETGRILLWNQLGLLCVVLNSN